MSRYLHWATSATAILCFTALAPIARADQATDVKAAAKAFVVAARQPDAARMKALVTSSSDPIIDSLVGMIRSAQKMNEAAEAKFQEKITPGLFSAKDVEALDDAEVKIDGDTADVSLKGDNGKRKPIVLKMENGTWKVDLLPNAQDAGRVTKSFTVMTAAASETAGEISDGKYKTAAEAKTAYFKKVVEGLERAGLTTREHK
jgi:hypothetical protein